jgi:Tat protein translocase TatB subunit
MVNMLGTLGGPELVLIFILALIVFGPRKLPEIGKTMGKMMAEFRRASSDLKRTLEDEVEAERYRTTDPATAPVVASGQLTASTTTEYVDPYDLESGGMPQTSASVESSTTPSDTVASETRAPAAASDSQNTQDKD